MKEENMNKKQKKELIKIIITGLAVAAAVILFHFVPLPGNLWLIELAVYIVIYLFIGGSVLIKAVKNIFSGSFLDENFLMAIATIGAFFLSEYMEAVAVMLFYCVGEWFQSCAVGKSRKSIASLMELRADFARVIREDGENEEVDPFELSVGDLILVKPGEKIPVDGVIEEGCANINTASITGESAPVSVSPGENVISGTVNTDGLLKIRVTKEFEESTVSKILELVENSTVNKSKTEKFITRFAAIYTPAVVGCAVLLAIIPSLITGNWAEWVRRALIFLVVSCPCALVISVPMSFFGGIGGASKRGILVKGADFLEKLAKADTFVFDKTGTITSGCFEVESVCAAEGVSEETLLTYALAAERFSNHPIAECVCGYCRKNAIPEPQAECEIEELAGLGVRCAFDGHDVYAGNRRLAEEKAALQGGETIPVTDKTAVYVVADGQYAGMLVLTDSMKPGAAEAISALRSLGTKQTVMLSGDKAAAAEAIAKKAGIDRCMGELLPGDKVEALQKILAEAKEMTVYTGDGINDAPVLALSDVGIAMGGIGQDAAIEAADIVIMDDDIAKLPLAVRIARKTMGIVRQNIVFAIGVKLLVLILTAFGLAAMWLAVFADVGVAVIAILNAMRAIKSPK